MDELIRRMRWTEANKDDVVPLVEREWIVTNGLGGYASSTVAGVCTRRYHGLLVAALPAPLGRMVMLNHLTEQVRLPTGRTVRLGGEQAAGGTFDLHGVEFLRSFHLEVGLPVWRWAIEDWLLEKRLLLLHEQNTVHVSYRLVEGQGTLRLKLRLAIHFRPHEEKVSTTFERPYALTAILDRHEVSDGSSTPPCASA